MKRESMDCPKCCREIEVRDIDRKAQMVLCEHCGAGIEVSRYSEEDVSKMWEETIFPLVRAKYEEDGVPDLPARRESFNDYLDSLIRHGEVTDLDANQYTYVGAKRMA